MVSWDNYMTKREQKCLSFSITALWVGTILTANAYAILMYEVWINIFNVVIIMVGYITTLMYLNNPETFCNIRPHVFYFPVLLGAFFVNLVFVIISVHVWTHGAFGTVIFVGNVIALTLQLIFPFFINKATVAEEQGDESSVI